ncbi:teneurin-m-like isoform X4 [Portunus trituberculatus]|uniref:teneurin-m-like isoform X4 n=1 Tax=Portunus trituberculatus TaxID=210409 RepID=UPI001E1CC0D6|nr:teneurin-m-like isoform X4 [Portunus trituberculatus]
MVAEERTYLSGGLLSAGDGTGGGRGDMSRLNGRVHTGPQHSNPAQYQAVPTQYHQGGPVQYQGSQGHSDEFEASCLVRTPSGNVYIPSDMPKTSTLEYKPGLHSPSLHCPPKADGQKTMEGYNVPFGGGLPAPVLPVRNNLRHSVPGTGPRGGGGPSSGTSRGPSNPHCSWRCTAIIFITIAVVLATILIYIAATSTLAWSAHGGCAVMVDDTTVITDEAHPGQAASRGNPQLPQDRLPQHPQQQFQPFFVVYDDVRELPRLDAPLHRMRRSVSHESPPRMDTHPQDSPIPSSLIPSDTPASSSFANPDPTSIHSSHSPVTDSFKDSDTSPKDSVDDSPAPSSHSHNSMETNSNTGSLFVDSDSDSTFLSNVNTNQDDSDVAQPSPAEFEHNKRKGLAAEFNAHFHMAHINPSHDNIGDPVSKTVTLEGSLSGPPIIREAREAQHVSFINNDESMDSPLGQKRNVFAPVVDVVEYSNDDDNVELPETDNVIVDGMEDVQEEILDTSFTYEEEITDDTDDSEKNLDSYEETEDSDEEVNEEALAEYEYGRNPENDQDVVEYIQVNETEGNSSTPFTQLPENNEFINTNSGRNLSAEFLPASMDDIMVGDDPLESMAQESDNGAAVSSSTGETQSKERKAFRSWMGGFPKLPANPSEVDNSSRESESNDAEQVPPEPNHTNRGKVLKSSVDAWFSRYGIRNSQTRNIGDKTASAESSGPLFGEAGNERFLFDSAENNGGRVTRQSAYRRGRSYDPNDPQGGPIPQSDPRSYPSTILEALGVPYYQDPTRSPPLRNRTFKGPVTARDVFPHIFEYDLDNHDDYYYEDDAYYYFDEYSVDSRPPNKEVHEFEDEEDEEDSTEIIFDEEDEDNDSLGEVQAAHRDTRNVVTMSPPHSRLAVLAPASTRVQATQYPPGLRAMSLTKEEFHVGVQEPQIRTLNQGQDELVEIEVVPLERNYPSVNSMETGTNYSPLVDNHNRETTVERKILETPTSAATTTSSPTPMVTSTRSPPVPPTPRPVDPSELLPPLHGAKFLTPHHRASPHAEISSEEKKIPKFLMHIAENNSAAPRGPSDNHHMSAAQPLNDNHSESLGKNTPHVYSPGSSASHPPRKSYEEQDEIQRYHSESSDNQDQVVSLPDHSRSNRASTHSNPEEETFHEDEAIRELHHNKSPSQYSSSGHLTHTSKSGRSKRVTVNVTIATDDGEATAGRGKSPNNPLYVLSVSVPTSGKDQKADITLVEPHEQQQVASVSIKINGNGTYDRNNSQIHEFFALPHTGQLVSGHGEKGHCQCPCSCDNDNSIPSFSQSLPSQSRPEESLATSRLHDSDSQTPVQGCASDPNPTTTTSTTTTTPPYMVGDKEIKDHNNRPTKTIPPDGTTFKMMELGQQLSGVIPPYGYWNMQFYQSESAYVKFEVSIPRGSSIGVYGRRNALPTHTSYDFLQVLSGYKMGSGRSTRASKVIGPLQPQAVTKYLEQGHWFLSLYNDDGDPQEVSLNGAVSSEYTEGCPRGCSGNGDCILGSCQCHAGYTGSDCTQMMCPVLCSGHGEYRDGECVCRPGWKGRECSIRHDECEVPDCNSHGHCVDGHCRCAKGYKGEFCEEDDCPHPTCSGHGWCVSGMCVCQRGWRGVDCNSRDDAALQCLPDCNNHGHFDLESHQCVCDPEWTGAECTTKVCDLDCGPHGRCEGGSCLCSAGWTGERCGLMTCDPRCEEHGQCKNGTCICMTGWNGRHCTLAGCPADCSNNGACIMENDEWVCRCESTWEGLDCSVKLETVCDDKKDNDNDGLVDCADAECCSFENCKESPLCLTSHDPIDILLRKQPPAVTASFFQRTRFIVEEGSVQNYAEMNAFNTSRASVVRGRVISGRGTGLRGVRVSHYRPADTGFTLTRPGGWFDLMVNGGGAVRLLFGKSPFSQVTATVWVPWNEIVVTDTIVMTMADVVPPPPQTPCPDHSYDELKPVVLATWKHGFQGGCPECSAILTESQVVQESLNIPGTGLHLVYHSSRALGYESTIQLQLTPSVIPETLRRIYLRITIEGILFEKTFEADPDIKFTYAWNRLNVYRQRVYGVTWAVVKVGFAYSNCDQIIWDAQTTQVSGHDMSISDIGGWDLSIQHRYNFHEGILQKGDGRNIHLKQKPRVMRNLMGDGHQREISCKPCDGHAKRQRLLTPAALASGPDGSLYIADFNLIRRILPDNTVKTVVSLNETRVSYRYHLAVSPVTGDVYISDHEAHLILKVRDPDDFSRPEQNYMPYVGSGERCLPGDEVGCGDNSLARDAKLQYPKGMALSVDDVLYFADGTNVRAVDSDGIITTVIGNHRHRAHWRPLPCEGTVPVSEVSLRWPTALAINPLDDSLYVLDDHHVLRLTHDGQIKVVAGRPLHCPPLSHDAPSDLAAHTTLRSPQSLAFAPNGDLYIAESDNERINRIRIIETDERIHDFAGADSKCNCQDENCQCFDESHVLAATAVFSTISALCVTPDGTVHVLDQGNLRIRSVTSSIPEPNAQRLYEVFSPETQEVYIFNRFGHHIETRSIPTRRTKYMFAYNVNTSNGRLSTVTDASGNRVSFRRQYTGQVTTIENSRQQKCRLQMSRTRKLMEFVTPDEHNITLTYHGATGLLRSRMDSTGRAHVYTYDTYGRLTRAVTPSGQVIDLSFDLSQKGARVTVTRDGTAPVTMLIKGALVTETVGSASSVTAQLADGAVVTRTAWGHHIATETVPYNLLQDHTLAQSYPVPGRQRTEIGDELVNSFDWKYFLDTRDESGTATQVGRKMRVNGEDLLTFKYDLFTGTEAILNENGATLLNVSYDQLGRPLYYNPAQPFLPVAISYDRLGQMAAWSWGDMREEYSYNRNGRFEGVTYSDGTKIVYSFKDANSVKPYKVSVSGGAEHLLEHDEGGALSGVTTPRGHKYTFHVQPSLLHNRFTFTPPGSPRHPYQLFYNDGGHILAEVLPHQSSRIIYHYDDNGRLHVQLFGDGIVEFGYHPETGLLRGVSVKERGFEYRSDNKYHAGLVKEKRVRFMSSTKLDSAKLRFLYDGNARPRRVEIEIDGKEQPDYDMKYAMILGTLESVGDMKITTTYHNKTVIQDSRKTMLRVIGYDPHGRMIESALTLRSRMVHRSKFTYDSRGRLASISTLQGSRSEVRTNYTYTPDGFLQAVDGIESWQFRYDKNGNIIAVVEGGREMTATYDNADRLVGWGDVELNTYSPEGTVVRQGEVHLSYSARGNLKSAWQQGHYKIWRRHDHRGRLIVWEDDHGNVTQFFYADLLRPDLPTHIHYPKQGETHSLEYDEHGHLMAIQTGRHKFWVSTDHLGSPVAVFDDSGVLIKEIVRSPWGATLSDSKPELLLHVDFQGGLRDPVTGFLSFGLHTYDPVHAMWMAPRYDLVTSTPDRVSAIYVHRFHDNDPVNKFNNKPEHYTDLYNWLRLFGVDLSKMMGSSYHDKTVEKQERGLLKASQLAPSLSVISGLSCLTEDVLAQFSQPSLLPDSLVRSETRAWAFPSWEPLERFSSSPPVLGPGVLVSRVNGRALVTLVPSKENPVVQDVARDVLNGSALLDITFTHHHHHTLYLVKENAELHHDDLQQLERLSGRFNVTSKETGEHHEIRVAGNDVSLILLYGVDPRAARHRLLRHAHHRAVTRAWENERLLVERGAPSTYDWTVEERVELVSKGSVSGYIPADLHSIHRYPFLADDPTNVVFRRDIGRRRRRSHPSTHS